MKPRQPPAEIRKRDMRRLARILLDAVERGAPPPVLTPFEVKGMLKA